MIFLPVDKVAPARDLLAKGVVQHSRIRRLVIPDIPLTPVEGKAAALAMNFVCENEHGLAGVKDTWEWQALLPAGRLHGCLIQRFQRRTGSPIDIAVGHIDRLGLAAAL